MALTAKGITTYQMNMRNKIAKRCDSRSYSPNNEPIISWETQTPFLQRLRLNYLGILGEFVFTSLFLIQGLKQHPTDRY